MTRNFKFFLFFFIFIFALLIFLIIGVKKSLFPEKISSIVNKTILILPYLNKKIEKNNTRIKQLERKILKLNSKIDTLEILSSEFTNLVESKKIKSKKNIYKIDIFKIPFMSQPPSSKAGAYAEQTDNEIIIASGKGDFFFFKKDDINLNSLNIKKIKTNIKDIIPEDKFYSEISSSSIKDLLIINNKVFFSYSKKQSQNCYNISIVVSEINFEYFEFSEFFSSEDCIPSKRNKENTLHVGGRMEIYKNNKILLTIGDNHDRTASQNKNTSYGKIISIDLNSNKKEIIAMGVRNSQGIYYHKDKDLILFTDHGPKGGDEININLSPDNETIENYGWPISSYGEEYDGKVREGSPLYKSHIDHGFIEPKKYFKAGIGISQIIKAPDNFNKKTINSFVFGALGYKDQIIEGDQSIHLINFDKDFSKIVLSDVIPVGERIRDMILINETNTVLTVLESIPAIGFVTLVN